MSDWLIGTDDEWDDYRRAAQEAADEEAYLQNRELDWHSLCESLGEKAWPLAAPATNTNNKDNNMKLGEAFPSKWLKAEDLGGKAHLVTIETVNQETVGQGADAEVKLVAYFKGAKKGVILNKTNANAIASKFGDETDDWGGAEVELYPEMVSFQGKTAPAIRIRVPVPQAAAGDEIPF